MDCISLANSTLAWQNMFPPANRAHLKSFTKRLPFSRLLRSAKGGAYAVKDFLAFHTRKPENTTDVYHFLKLYYADVP